MNPFNIVNESSMNTINVPTKANTAFTINTSRTGGANSPMKAQVMKPQLDVSGLGVDLLMNSAARVSSSSEKSYDSPR